MDGAFGPVTMPDRIEIERRLLRARGFLHARRKALYGDRELLFDAEKSYCAYDAMLKRNILYVRFGIREVVAEARAGFGSSGATLLVHRRPGLERAQGGAPDFLSFLRGKRLVPAPGASPERIDLGWRSMEAEILAMAPEHVGLKLSAIPERRENRFRPSARTVCQAWFQSLLAEWIRPASQLRLDGGRALLAPDVSAWSLSRRISQVDIDLSGEDAPHVFRWKETTLAGKSTYAEWDEADIAAALEASGITLPVNAQRQARLREDLGRGSACLLLRYAHLIPDPDYTPGAGGSGIPDWMNPGYIVMENDYWEILADAGTGKVFSEARKWRPEGNAERRPGA